MDGTNLTVNADADGIVVPLVALKWIIRNTSTNVDLATISNVSKSWRTQVIQTILEDLLDRREENFRDDDAIDAKETENERTISDSQQSRSRPFRNLLLPSMVRQYWVEQRELQLQRQGQRRKVGDEGEAAANCDYEFELILKNTNESQRRNRTADDETYCIAWFDPDGIRTLRLSPRNSSSNSSSSSTSSGSEIISKNENNRATSSQQLEEDEQHQQLNIDETTKFTAIDHRLPTTSGDEDTTFLLPQVNDDDQDKGTVESDNRQQLHHYPSTFFESATNGAFNTTEERNYAFAAGTAGTGGDATQKKSQEKKKDGRDDSVECVYQWDGYSSAYDVLMPFGYVRTTVHEMFGMTSAKLVQALPLQRHELSDHKNNNNNNDGDDEDDKDDEAPNRQNPLFRKQVSMQSNSTSDSILGASLPSSSIFPSSCNFAVRGATYARPEGYCLCWDNDTLVRALSERSRSDSTRAILRQKEWENIQRKRSRRRLELQREVLPVVIRSQRSCNRQKSQIQASNVDADDTEQDQGIGMGGVLQPCVQFLNFDSSHAVRIFTPPFQNGPISTPVTVFCVAIATEDACFFSGLRKRFELGHLYPQTNNDCLIERSPVCLCADYKATSSTELGTRTHDKLSAIEQQQQYHSDNSSSAGFGSLEAMSGDPGFKCNCPFSGLGDIVDEGEDTSMTDLLAAAGEDAECEDDEFGHIARGRLGPGSWHCYVAIFDGQDSAIRIDGVTEPTVWDTVSHLPERSVALLDGLTIGSDHSFDMSLCFGNGSDGEGEGAMAELAFFKGRLALPDIEVVEQHLIRKYGIVHPPSSGNTVAIDDEFSRRAHALLAQSYATDKCSPSPRAHQQDCISSSSPGRMKDQNRGIPLKYMTKLRQVAWKQTSAVTGAKVTVERIGARNASSDSEW